MRNALMYLTLLGSAILAVILLLPILGVILLVVALGIGLLLAAPLLARLPWFRNRIIIRTYTSRHHHRPDADANQPRPTGQLDDVIDVEGRELPDKE